MEEKYFSFIDRFIPEKNKKEDNIYFQSVLLVSAFIFSSLFLIIFITIHYFIHYYIEIYALSFSLIIMILSFIFYPQSGNNKIFGNIIIAGAFISFLAIALSSGGIYAGVLPWFTAVSVTGFLFANKKSGYFWSAMTIITIITLFVLDLNNIKFPFLFPEKFKDYNYFTSFLGSAIYLILIVLSYEFLNTKKNLKLNAILQKDREKREELLQQQEEIMAQRDMLVDSEQKTRKILESMPDAIFMIDEHGRVSFWNHVIEEMTGIKAENIIGKGNFEYAKPFYGEPRPILIDLVQIDDLYLKENYSNIIKHNNILQAETYVPSMKGVERYLIGRATAIYDSKDNYSGAIEVIHDITERTKAKEKIEKQKEQLERLSLVASKTDNAISILDAKGNFLWINNAFETLYGYNLDSLFKEKGENITQISNNPEIKQIIEKIISEKKPMIYENNNIDKNNNIIYTQTNLSPILNKHGEVEKIIAIDSDISKLKNTLDELQQTKEELLQQQEEIMAQRDLLSDSEQKTRKILESMPDAVFMIDEHGRVSFWNHVIEEMTGIKAKNIIGKGNFEYAKPFYGEPRPILIDLVQIEDLYLKENYSNIIKHNNILQAETYVPSMKGVERYLIGRATAIYDSKGNYSGAIEVIHDITERRKVRDKIEQQKKQLERLSLVASKTDNAISILDAKGNFLWINNAFETLYGYNLDSLFKEKGENITQISNNPEIKQIIEEIISEKKPMIYENNNVDKNNNIIYTQTNLSPILNKHGEVEKIIAIDSDISKLKNTLDELQQTKEELLQQQEEIMAQRDLLSDSEQRTRKILESMPDAVFMIDEHGRVSFWNHVIEEMTGIKAENIIGKGNFEYAKPFYGEPRPILIDLVQIDDLYLKENYSNIIKHNNILQAETYVPSMKGIERYLIGMATALYDSKGNYTGAIEVIHDITNRKRISEKIEIQKKNIEASIRYAKHIQQAVFPVIDNLKNYFNDYFIYFKPRDIVSGDFYWTAEVKNGLIIATADCTGHGVPGAFMSLLGISYLNEIVFEQNIHSPEEILNILRHKVITLLHQDKDSAKDGMDMAICKINTKNKKLEYAGAHNPLVLIRNNEIIEYKADRMPVGFYYKIDIANFVKNEISIEKNDKFYIFSDGFQDQLSQKNGKVYSKKFKQLLLQNNQMDFASQKSQLNKFFYKWKGNYPQTDDILIIGFEVKLSE